jgi:hypothetical protein
MGLILPKANAAVMEQGKRLHRQEVIANCGHCAADKWPERFLTRIATKRLKFIPEKEIENPDLPNGRQVD